MFFYLSLMKVAILNYICTGHFVMVPLNMTYLHCLQHSLFEYLFNLYCHILLKQAKFTHLFQDNRFLFYKFRFKLLIQNIGFISKICKSFALVF